MNEVRFKRKWGQPNTEATHATMHIVKAAGKLAQACDDAGHGREAIWATFIADVVISAYGLAFIIGLDIHDLESVIETRLQEKNT